MGKISHSRFECAVYNCYLFRNWSLGENDYQASSSFLLFLGPFYSSLVYPESKNGINYIFGIILASYIPQVTRSNEIVLSLIQNNTFV